MNVGELRQKLDGLPDDMPIRVEYEAGCCESEDVAVAVEDGWLLIDTAVKWAPLDRVYR